MALALRAPANHRIGDRPVGLRLPYHARQCRPGSTRCSSLSCQSCRNMKGCLNRGWEYMLPAWPSPYAPQPTSSQPVRLGFPHPAERCRPASTRFWSPGCRSCRYVEKCLNRGWEPILPGQPSPYAAQPTRLGFPHRAGQCRPGSTRCSSLRCQS